VAATKAYRQLDDEWYDYSLRQAVELAGSDGSPARAILFSGLVEVEAKTLWVLTSRPARDAMWRRGVWTGLSSDGVERPATTHGRSTTERRCSSRR
jgi:hypothetical protein